MQRALLQAGCISALASICLVMPFAWVMTHAAFDNQDLRFYATIGRHFSEQLWQGELYPRWLMQVNAGVGSPVFLFYNPLAFYVFSLFQPLTPGDASGLLRLSLSAGCALFFSGVTLHQWLIRHYPAQSALVGMMLFLLVPYRLILLYLQGGVAQLWALVWLPLLLWAVDRIVQRERGGIAQFAVAFALLILTHSPSIISFAPLIGLYILLHVRLDLRGFGAIAMAGLIGLALSSAYLVPMVMNYAAIDTHAYLTFRIDTMPFRSYFIHPFIISSALLCLLAAFICMAPERLRMPHPRLAAFASIGLLWTFYLLLPNSLWLWEWLKITPYVQFPFRLMAPAMVLIALLAAQLHIANLLLLLQRLALVLGSIFLLNTLQIIIALADNAHTTATSGIAEKLVQYDRYSIVTPNEYRTRWQPVTPQDLVAPFASMKPAAFIQGSGEITLQQGLPHAIALQTHVTSKTAQLQLKQLYFPGWQVQIDGKPVLIAPSQPEGLIIFAVPEGTHNVTAYFEPVGAKAGMWLSLLGLLLTCASLKRSKY